MICKFHLGLPCFRGILRHEGMKWVGRCSRLATVLLALADGPDPVDGALRGEAAKSDLHLPTRGMR